jgi:uncharacterized hydrophobic protein (TIGR00271 family)
MMSTNVQPGPALVDARMSLGAAALDDLFPEGEAFRASLRTYTVLLVLAAFVATFGLYQDSVASIIGAMVIAPLGGAIMAVAGALVTGRLDWQPRTLAQVLVSAAGVIAIGFGVSVLLPDPLVLNPSLDARTEPGLLDLGVALAAGAAGAWVASHRTGSDALPGVAIAVSLVPPLATVGICLELGRLDDAAGALILFTTNFAAIVVAASVVFVLAGGRPTLATDAERRRFRLGIIAGAIGLVVISIPLAWHGVQTVSSELAATQVAPVVEAWVGDRDLVVTAYQVDGQRIDLAMTGPSAPTDLSVLADELVATLGHPVELSVTFAPRTVIETAGG